MKDNLFLNGLDNVHSNNVKRCAVCGIPITPANDSGWEIFVEEGKQTQPICAWCDAERNIEPIGKQDEQDS